MHYFCCSLGGGGCYNNICSNGRAGRSANGEMERGDYGVTYILTGAL